MESNCSLPCSQALVNSPSLASLIHFSFILPPKRRPYDWSPPFWLANQDCAHIFHLPHECYMLYLSYSSWCYYPNNILSRVYTVELVIMQLPSVSRHFVCLRSKCFPNHLLSYILVPNVRDNVSCPCKTTSQF